MAAKREAEETERKRKSAQQAKEARKAKGAEHNQRASVASRGKTADTTGSARTTASRGDILSYAALVRARVASNKPGGTGGGGTVVVSFGVLGRRRSDLRPHQPVVGSIRTRSSSPFGGSPLRSIPADAGPAIARLQRAVPLQLTRYAYSRPSATRSAAMATRPSASRSRRCAGPSRRASSTRGESRMPAAASASC